MSHAAAARAASTAGRARAVPRRRAGRPRRRAGSGRPAPAAGRDSPKRGSSRGGQVDDAVQQLARERRDTSASGMCTVASTTFSGSDQNIIATRARPVRWPSRSVCPFHGRPARANASLLTGAVAMPATTPACASRTAAQIASYAARPAVRRQHARARTTLRPAGRTGPARRRSSTRDPRDALRAISGPMPAGSPTVIAMRGFVIATR